MRDDLDSVVADRFTVLDDVPVPDTWSRVQFKLLDPTPVQWTEAESTLIDLVAPSPSNEGRQRRRWVLAAAAVLLVAVAAVVLLERGSDKPAVVTTTTPDTTTAEGRASTISNGWVAFVDRDPLVAVSYTHLTLPTKRIV